MSEQVVVICSPGEQDSARSVCARLEEQGLTCWSPVREEDPDAALWTLPSKLRSARAMVLVATDPGEHSEAIEAAAQSRLPVIMAQPDGDQERWDGVMRELGDALGLSGDWFGARPAVPGAQPKTHLAEDEEEHLEFIAESVMEAQVFVRFGLFDRAIGRLRPVFSKAPRNLEAHDALLKIYLETEDWKKAAGAAADFLDCLRFRGDQQSYAILRDHLLSMGFSVDDGPPVAVGYSDVDPIPTKFFDTGVKPSVVHTPPPAPTAPVPSPTLHPSDPSILELPVLRDFKSSNPLFQANGIDSDLSGIDFFFDHGMLDEARIRVDQLARENPDHPGVRERLKRIEALGQSAVRPLIALELDDPWDAAARATSDEATADASFPREATPEARPYDGPVGEGDALVCTAFVPESVEPGDMFVVRVVLHLPEQNDHPALESHHDRREVNMLARKVEWGRSVQISLTLPGFEIDDAHLQIAWAGDPDSVEFGVVTPFGHASGLVNGELSVTTEEGPAGQFSIAIPVK